MISRVNSHCMQASTAAVQTTHSLRLLAALALAVLLQVAKATIYSSHQISCWQQALAHLYDMPPVILLTLVQLSAVALVARQYKNLPSSIPAKVGCTCISALALCRSCCALLS